MRLEATLFLMAIGYLCTLNLINCQITNIEVAPDTDKGMLV